MESSLFDLLREMYHTSTDRILTRSLGHQLQRMLCRVCHARIFLKTSMLHVIPAPSPNVDYHCLVA